MFQFVSRRDDKEADLPPRCSCRASPCCPPSTSMVYLLAHPNDRESPAYLTKFRACLTMVLEMVRSHMERVLETATSAASQ